MLTHVLIVAENATTDAMTRHHLRQQGCRVHSQEALQAVDWARRHLPDLIVWSGPDGGLPFGFRDLRLDPATWNIPIVHLVEPPGRTAGLRVEADVRLDCPNEVDFAEAIRQVVSARDERLEEGIRTELRLSLLSDLDELEPLCSLMAYWFTLCGLKAYQNHQTTLALRELTANAIEWGHRYERERRVEVCTWLEADRVGVLVRDSGPGFDRADLPHAARHGDSFSHLDVRAAVNLREGGFGILMARGFVDYLCYNEKGNEGLLVKFLPLSARLADAS
jgi:anti-sigma regulatory factor (Ser/Thr protein kinase)/CheY-like chemotaxis protein